MGLVRIKQLLAAVESTEGTPVSLTSSNYVDALNVTRTIDQQIEDEETSGASLSEDLGTVGRGSCGFSFSTRYYGLNGTSGVAVPPLVNGNAPLDDMLLRASGMRSTTVNYLLVSSPPTIATWAGMTLNDGNTPTAGTAILAAPITAGRCYYIAPTGGFPNGQTSITVAGSAMTLTNATPDGFAYGYVPDSQPSALITLTSGTWSGGGTPLVGDILTNGLDGVNAARARLLSISGTLIEVEPVLFSAKFNAADTIQGTAVGRTGSTTVAAPGQVLNRVPSLTMQCNVGGHVILGTGMRGNCTLNLEAGKIPLAQWEFSGSRSSTSSADPISGTNVVSASSIPRWQSALVSADGFEIPISSCQVSFGNTVSLIPDAHGAQGIRGSAITARQFSVTVDFDRVNQGVYNFISRMENATTLSFYTQWGTQAGLRQAIWMPRCQIYQQGDGDREGTLTASITLRPKRRTADGDNEAYLLFGLQ